MTENKAEIHIKSITQCRVETMYKTSCMMDKIVNSTKLSSTDLHSCVKERKDGDNFIAKSVVPMWVVYQFFVSVVLLRILIVMLTITYNKILANLNNMWKYARLYLIIQALQCFSLMLSFIYCIIPLISYNLISQRRNHCFLQFFDADSLLPPPFTFLSLLMYLIRNIEKKTFSKKGALQRTSTRKFKSMAAKDIEYRSLIFSFIDNVKPQPDVHKGKVGQILYHIILT